MKEVGMVNSQYKMSCWSAVNGKSNLSGGRPARAWMCRNYEAGLLSQSSPPLQQQERSWWWMWEGWQNGTRNSAGTSQQRIGKQSRTWEGCEVGQPQELFIQQCQ